MSEVSKVDEGQQSTGEHQVDANQVNVNELVERLKALESTNARLLEESKKTKSKYHDVLSQYEAVDKERLEKEGNFQALLEKEVGKNNSLMQEMNEMKKKVLSSNIKQTVSKFASDVYDIEDLLNQPKFSHILKDGIDDSTLSINEEKVKEYVSTVLKEKPYMRKVNNNIPTIDTKPNAQFHTNSKTVEEMSATELEEIIKSRFSN